MRRFPATANPMPRWTGLETPAHNSEVRGTHSDGNMERPPLLPPPLSSPLLHSSPFWSPHARSKTIF
eukprot:scaffold222635_cov31-Tisochrysis_lutea.AAC.5